MLVCTHGNIPFVWLCVRMYPYLYMCMFAPTFFKRGWLAIRHAMNSFTVCLTMKNEWGSDSDIQMRTVCSICVHILCVYKCTIHMHQCLSMCVYLLMHACLCMCVHNRLFVSIANDFPINKEWCLDQWRQPGEKSEAKSSKR